MQFSLPSLLLSDLAGTVCWEEFLPYILQKLPYCTEHRTAPNCRVGTQILTFDPWGLDTRNTPNMEIFQGRNYCTVQNTALPRTAEWVWELKVHSYCVCQIEFVMTYILRKTSRNVLLYVSGTCHCLIVYTVERANLIFYGSVLFLLLLLLLIFFVSIALT